MLDVRGITIRYGPILAVEDVSFTVEPGEVVALLGANGAGKSSTLNAIAGVVKPAAGQIHWRGDRIDGMRPQRVVRKGVALVPEGRQLFPDLTVLDNLRLGAYARHDGHAVGEDLELVYEYFPLLRERTKQHAGTLSGGEQQMLAIGRALMARPTLLLLDEPSLGLAPKIVARIFDIITAISTEQDLSLLLVEQNAAGALNIASRANVLETGRLVLSGSADALRNDATVQESYLGV
jgi:branched-chain amino acid transport system ATP-binding protein